jgi:hypothetical protein
MKRYIALFEDFKKNNLDGNLISIDDIIKTIKDGGAIRATIIEGRPDHDENDELKPISIDDDGLVIVEIEGNEYYINIEDIIELKV